MWGGRLGSWGMGVLGGRVSVFFLSFCFCFCLFIWFAIYFLELSGAERDAWILYHAGLSYSCLAFIYILDPSGGS